MLILEESINNLPESFRDEPYIPISYGFGMIEPPRDMSGDNEAPPRPQYVSDASRLL